MAVLVLGTFFLISVFAPDLLPTREGEQASRMLLSLLLVATLLQSAVGGYVAATAAKHREYQHGFALIGVMLFFGALSLVNTESTGEPLWYALSTIATGVLGVLIGTNMRIRQKDALHIADENGDPHEHIPESRGFQASP